MYINHVSAYLPEEKLRNDAFSSLNGLSSEWIIERTGIEERRVAGEQENTTTMAIEAVKNGLQDLPYNPKEINLIIGASYTPHDSIVTIAHHLQHYLDVPDVPAVSISSACSSFLNAMEIVEGYFAMGKADNALVVVSEHNSLYNDLTNTMSGHLWGDGAAAVFVTKEKKNDKSLSVKEIKTAGAATVGKATQGVNLLPHLGKEGLFMEHGRDVFINACTYMAGVSQKVLESNDLGVEDLKFFIPHQANLRIAKNVAKQLNLSEEKVVSNIQRLGNTGCAGCVIGLGEKWDEINTGDRVMITVFGGGYSYGSMLLEC